MVFYAVDYHGMAYQSRLRHGIVCFRAAFVEFVGFHSTVLRQALLHSNLVSSANPSTALRERRHSTAL